MHNSELRNKINKNLQERLITLRKSMHVTQEEVAKQTGVGRTSILSYERGTSIPDLEKLYLLAEYYGVDCDYLLGRDNGNNTYKQYLENKNKLLTQKIKELYTICEQ